MFVEEETKEELRSSSTSHGPIHITEEDVEGLFIRLHNKGEEEYLLGGHELVRKTEGDDRPVKYKFHRNFKIQANDQVTIWSSDSGEVAKPPHTLVMKTLKWAVGDAFTTELLNADEEVVAQRESKKEMVTYKKERKRGSLGEDGKEKCAIM